MEGLTSLLSAWFGGNRFPLPPILQKKPLRAKRASAVGAGVFATPGGFGYFMQVAAKGRSARAFLFSPEHGMASVYLNGKIIDESAAGLPVQERGFLYGDGLFETMRAYGGRIFRLREHLARLRASASFLRLTVPVSDDETAAALGELIEANECPDAYARLTLTRGATGRGMRLDPPATPTLLIAARSLQPRPEDHYRHGVKLIISSCRQSSHNPLARHKTLNYLLNLLAHQEAADAGAHGAVLLNELGQVTEESAANIFIVRGGKLVTPPPHCGLLPGIARATVMELAAAQGVALEERPIPAAELFDAEEMFLTNSLVEVMPVRQMDRRALPQKAPGPVTAGLMRAYGGLTGNPPRG
jgi:branched-chain amino acid aminotransferase